MSKSLKFLVLPLVVILISSLFPYQTTLAASTPEPIVLAVDQNGANIARPLVLGLTWPNTEVLIYVNGEFAGLAKMNREETGTDNFYFQPSTVWPAGVHSISAIARDLDSLVQSAMTEPIEFEIPLLAAPTLVAPNESTATGKVKPLVAGLTRSGTKVMVFIDGVLNGMVNTVTHESGTANFAYRPFLNLSVGEHQAYAIAEDEQGQKSGRSNVLKFKISEPTSAPTIFNPIANQVELNKPFIVGNAQNDTKIRVFIDRTLYGEFNVKNHESGTANFAYKPFIALAPGGHFAYTTAVDSRGIESIWSNIVYFDVGRPASPAISDTAAADESPVVKGDSGVFNQRLNDLIDLARQYAQDKTVDISPSQKAELEELLKDPAAMDISAEELPLLKSLSAAEEGVNMVPETEADKANMDDIKSILDAAKNGPENETGMINESKQAQSKLNVNLVIFILFLIAVIVWIFWVNRELIKEKQEENKDKKEDQNKFKL